MKILRLFDCWRFFVLWFGHAFLSLSLSRSGSIVRLWPYMVKEYPYPPPPPPPHTHASISYGSYRRNGTSSYIFPSIYRRLCFPSLDFPLISSTRSDSTETRLFTQRCHTIWLHRCVTRPFD